MMQYIFLVVAAAWSLQFLLSYWQLQRFHHQLANLRKLGRCAVGMYGNRWRGRTYGILVVDAHDRVSHAASFSGWTIFSKLQPVASLKGMRRDAILAMNTPIAQLHRSQWLAFQHAAQFFNTQSTPSNHPTSSTVSDQHV
jgi:DNA-binding transcriptional regulator of glucitol operon